MTRRGIEVPEQPAVPVRLMAGEQPVRNEERFRSQVVDMFRQRDREIEDLLRRVGDLEKRVADLEAGP